MKNLIPYIYDFLGFVFDDEESKKCIKNIILFGSVATGEYDKQSDIDLFIEPTSDAVSGKVEQIAKEADNRFSTLVEKKWSLIGVELPIRYIIGNLGSYRWKELKSEIISTGITLYGKYVGVKDGLKHFSIFSYDLSKLSNKKKALFIRQFSGYSQKRKGKKYSSAGYLNEIGGVKIGRGAVLVPIEKSGEAHKFFTSFGITPEIREIWVKE